MRMLVRICVLLYPTEYSFGRIADTACTGLLTGTDASADGGIFLTERILWQNIPDSLLAMQLPLNAVSSGEVTRTIREQIVNVNGTDYIQVHPLFFYESIWCRPSSCFSSYI